MRLGAVARVGIDGGIGIVRSRGDGKRQYARPDEAGEIVDMPVGMIVEQAFPQPQHVRQAQAPRQQGFDLPAIKVGIAIGVEQALFGRDEQAGAVGVDRSAFEYPVLRRCGKAGGRRQPCADILITRHPIFAAPAVEAEINQRATARAVQHRDRRGVAQPYVAQFRDNDADSCIDQVAGDPCVLVMRDDQPHLLALAPGVQGIGESRDLFASAIECAGPFVGVGRKADPGPVVRRPFGGHAEGHVQYPCPAWRAGS